jgi:hypothetical protein
MKITKSQWFATLLIVATILFRTVGAVPGPVLVTYGETTTQLNLSPVIGASVIAGLVLTPPLAIAVPVVSMFASDIVLYNKQINSEYAMNFQDYMSMSWMTYALMGLVSFGSLYLSRIKFNKYAKSLTAGLTGSSAFWIISNFMVWLIPAFNFGMYPQTLQGLINCYVAAIPFGASDMFSTIIFVPAFMLVYSFVSSKIEKKVLA